MREKKILQIIHLIRDFYLQLVHNCSNSGVKTQIPTIKNEQRMNRHFSKEDALKWSISRGPECEGYAFKTAFLPSLFPHLEGGKRQIRLLKTSRNQVSQHETYYWLRVIVCCPKGNFWDWKGHCSSLHSPVYGYRWAPIFNGSTYHSLTLWWCEYNKHSVETTLWSFPGLAINMWFHILSWRWAVAFPTAATRSQGETRGTYIGNHLY